MNCKEEDGDGSILNEIQLNDTFMPINFGSFQQPEPRLSIRKPQEINQKASNTTSQTRRRSISSSPEVQYEGTFKKSKREIQRQDSSSSFIEVNFQGFPTRYSKMKLVKASLRSSPDGMMSYMNINRDIMLRSWERNLQPNIISGNSSNGFCRDGFWSPQAPEFPERSNGNERLRHPSQNSSTMISPTTEINCSDNFRNPLSPLSTSNYYNNPHADPRLISKNQDHIHSINSSSPLWNPDPPQSFSSPPGESRIPLRNPDPPCPPPPPLSPPPPPPLTFRQPSPPYDPRSDLRNPDPPQASFRQPSPPYDSRSDLRNPDPPQASFGQLSPRNPDPPHFNFQASYENRTCLTNPDPPQYISQPSFEKTALSYENRTCLTNPDPPQFNLQSSHEEPGVRNNESIASMINTIRNNESSEESSFRKMDSIGLREDSIDKQCSPKQSIHIDKQISENKEEQENLESMTINETIDLEIARRCPVYMKGLKCHKGEYCEKLHSLPREDKVPCMYFKGEGCRRTASDCWFWHPGEKVAEFVINDDAPTLVPSMGDILGYIKKEQAANPDKYKSKIIPTNEIAPDKVVIPAAIGNANYTPLGRRQISELDSNRSLLLPHLTMANSTNIVENVSNQELSPSSIPTNEKSPAKVVIPAAIGNANHTPLGRRQISTLDSKRSPLLPHLTMANSTNIVENVSNQQLSPPSTESNPDLTSPSKDLISLNPTENSSIEVSRIKLSRPAKVGAPRKRGVENMNNDSSSLTCFKIPKKNSSTAKSSSIINETITKNSKPLKTTKLIDIPKNQSSQIDLEKNIKTTNREISNETAKDNKIKSNVNDSKKIKSNRTSKNEQSSKIDNKEKENSKKSNETNAQTKRKARIISESEEESTAVKETKEKMQGKKSKTTHKKSNKTKRTRIESSEESGDDSSQTLVSTNEILASPSDETIPEKSLKKINMPSKKLKKSDRDLSVEGAKEDPGANVTKNKKSKSSHEKEDKIISKQTMKHDKKGNELKKSTIESDEVSEEKNSKSVITKEMKLKSGAQGKEIIQTKNSKNSTKRINKPRMTRIESSSESETEAPQTLVTNDEKSVLNEMSEEQNAKKSDDPKITNIKVEKVENKKPIVIEEISLLSDSDEDINDTVVKSETFLSEEANEINFVRERKAMDDILWGIDKELENLEEGSGGTWKRTPNHIEKDLYEVITLFEMEKIEDTKYPDIYNLDVNYRQLFLKLSGIDNDVQKHALLCKIRYPNCTVIPKDHEEDMSCCR